MHECMTDDRKRRNGQFLLIDVFASFLGHQQRNKRKNAEMLTQELEYWGGEEENKTKKNNK